MTRKLPYADDRFHDECGVFGVFGHAEAANLAYLGLYALQHRGQESAGIVSSTGNDLFLEKAMGEVEEIFQPRVLAKLPGGSAIGHTRYSTAGDKALLNVQPIMIDCNKGKMAVAHNGNLTNASEWRRKLEHRGSIFQTNSDTEVIVHLVARSQARNLSGALGDALNQLEGAYSLVVLTAEELFAVRDPRGFRPLALGRIAGQNGAQTWMVASETCAFDLLNAQYVREIAPGEMLRISRAGLESIHFSPPKPHQYCIFEHVYFSRPDSTVFGRSVNESREMLGRLLAREHPVEADMIVPIPDSGVPAAIGFALESKIPFRMGLIRNHYIGRTFIEPSQAIRNFGVKLKLNPVRSLIAGKRVALVDDSIVRGTTSRKLVRMVREAGAKHFALLLRCGHANEGRTDCFLEYTRGDSQVPGGRFAGLPVVGGPAAGRE
jgi:amidophosphoribosyltransferase